MARPILFLCLLFAVLGTPAGAGAEVASPRAKAQLGGEIVRVQGQRRPAPRTLRQWRLPERRGPSQEPASARGYDDGYRRGMDDGRNRNRYDAVGQRSYRSADAGYSREYGSRDAYRNNYRAGFRQGYEDGFRDGARGRR